MIVNTPPYLVLLATTLVAFYLSPIRWRYGIVSASGVLFYLWAAPAVLPLVVGLILLTHWATGRAGVWINVAALAGLMAYFKLRGGFGVLGAGGLSGGTVVDRVIFPLGLSFLTFELIHYAIERRRGKVPRASLSGLAAFALFFPCRIAGPIKRYQAFDESVWTARWSIRHLYRGLVRILIGFVKKVLVADVLSLTAFELNYPGTSALHLWKSLLAYSLYIYLDFSAYSDIAIGTSWLFGLRVPENFRSPYTSRNIRDFWSRWHMSLSSWLGDYLFLPISKRLQTGPARISPRAAAVTSYLATFALCGVWHGPSMNFLLWGLFHGALLAGYAVYHLTGWSLVRADSRSRFPMLIGRLAASGLTFVLVTLGWGLFAMPATNALALYRSLFGGAG